MLKHPPTYPSIRTLSRNPNLNLNRSPTVDEPQIPSPSPNPSNENDPATASPTGDAGEHLEGIVLEGEPEAHPSAAPGVIDPDGFLSREAFYAVFAKSHQLAGQATQLQTLIRAPDQPETRGASDAIYDICRDTSALHWIIRPGSLWFQRIAVLLAYGIGLGAGVRAELRVRRSPAAEPASAAEPAQSDAEFRDQEMHRAGADA